MYVYFIYIKLVKLIKCILILINELFMSLNYVNIDKIGIFDLIINDEIEVNVLDVE